MKFFFLITVISFSLLICSCGKKKQTTQAKLNQIELMKQFAGSWKVEESKDTSFFWDARLYGSGLEGNYKTVSNGKIISDGKFLQGYDKNSDKSIYVELSSSSDKDIELNATWFVSNTKYKYILLSDVSNFEKASEKITGEFTSPDIFVETTIKDNKVAKVETYTRVN